MHSEATSRNHPGWTLTDDFSFQHVREIDQKTFELIEMAPYNPDKELYEVYADTIDLHDYPEEEVTSILHSFGYQSVAEVRGIDGATANQIIAECIFEHYGTFAVEPLHICGMAAAQEYIRLYIADIQKEM